MKISIVNGSSETELLQQMYIINSWAAKEALNEGRKFCPIYEYDQVFETYIVFNDCSDPFNTKEDIEEHYRENAVGYKFRVCPFCKEKTVSCEDFEIISENVGVYDYRERKKIKPVFRCSNHRCNEVLDFYGMSIGFDSIEMDRSKVYNNRRSSLCKSLGVGSGFLSIYETYKEDIVFDVMLYTMINREAKGCQ